MKFILSSLKDRASFALIASGRIVLDKPEKAMRVLATVWTTEFRESI